MAALSQSVRARLVSVEIQIHSRQPIRYRRSDFLKERDTRPEFRLVYPWGYVFGHLSEPTSPYATCLAVVSQQVQFVSPGDASRPDWPPIGGVTNKSARTTSVILGHWVNRPSTRHGHGNAVIVVDLLGSSYKREREHDVSHYSHSPCHCSFILNPDSAGKVLRVKAVKPRGGSPVWVITDNRPFSSAIRDAIGGLFMS